MAEAGGGGRLPEEPAAVGLPVVQFLAWVAARPRRYAETMEAWRSSCPRLSVWEDALGDGLVRVEGGGAGGMGEARVVLTVRGRGVLGGGGEGCGALPRTAAGDPVG